MPRGYAPLTHTHLLASLYWLYLDPSHWGMKYMGPNGPDPDDDLYNPDSNRDCTYDNAFALHTATRLALGSDQSLVSVAS